MSKTNRSWKKGVITKELRAVGGGCIKKGSEVSYKRTKTLRDSDGFKLTEYEWHYMTTDAYIRTIELIIEGVEYKKEEYK